MRPSISRVSLPSARIGAVAGGREEAADAGAGGADALGQVALRHQLQLDLAGAVERRRSAGESTWRGKQQMILRTRPGGEQRGQAGVAVAGVVVDDRRGRARPARSARRSVRRAGRRCRSRRSSRSRRRGTSASGRGRAFNDLVDHRVIAVRELGANLPNAPPTLRAECDSAVAVRRPDATSVRNHRRLARASHSRDSEMPDHP